MTNGWLVAGAMALAIGCAGVGYWAGGQSAEKDCAIEAANAKTDDQRAVINKQAEYRQEETRRDDVVENVSRETEAVAANIAVGAAVSDDAAKRLRDQLAAAERRFNSSLATCDARVAEQSKAAAEDYRLLAELCRESDAAAGLRAKEAEDYRLAGEACEAIYDGVRNSPRN